MPSNTTALPPRKEPTGQTQLPLSRVKRIIGTDPDIALCSNNAAFVITLAAEMFVQHLAGAAHDASKLEAKPRKNLQYKDLANAISANDNLEFLEDVVPKTQPYKAIRQKANETRARINGDAVVDGDNGNGKTKAKTKTKTSKTKAKSDDPPLQNGKKQQKLLVNGGSGLMDISMTSDRDEDPNAQLELEASQAAGGDVVMKD
ncbi:uncharacterized protein DNG_02429 [Cephalotrichum gorgonifer]|uniref:Transcription factor CBF/NF-Y/archaeal histone domain-containing protein n=1 Tax=Cephalotrichum gorgonifer TaxID=2041049 RepID=A0AAE8SSK0_9PEZI|nr:uncharacterized protein DNG_02429 [Cephalotrichum gorgonifer]